MTSIRNGADGRTRRPTLPAVGWVDLGDCAERTYRTPAAAWVTARIIYGRHAHTTGRRRPIRHPEVPPRLELLAGPGAMAAMTSDPAVADEWIALLIDARNGLACHLEAFAASRPELPLR